MAIYITEDGNVYCENEPDEKRELFPNEMIANKVYEELQTTNANVSNLQTAVSSLNGSLTAVGGLVDGLIDGTVAGEIDADTLTETGIYRVAYTSSNIPSSSGALIVVFHCSDLTYQLFLPNTVGYKIQARMYYHDTWGSWRVIE